MALNPFRSSLIERGSLGDPFSLAFRTLLARDLILISLGQSGRPGWTQASEACTLHIQYAAVNGPDYLVIQTIVFAASRPAGLCLPG